MSPNKSKEMKRLFAALVIAGAAAGYVKTRFLKNPAAKKMTATSGKVSCLLRLLEFSGCMASFLRGRLGLAALVIVWISQIDLFCTKFQIYWRQFNETHKNNS
jgi:hypothetical protein